MRTLLDYSCAKHKMHSQNANCPLTIFAYLGVDFHGEEEPKVGMRSEGVQLLLKLDQPLWGQVDVLQQHPAPCLGGRRDGLLCEIEALSRPWT